MSGFGKDSFGAVGEYQSLMRKVAVPVLSTGQCESLLRTTKLGDSFTLDGKSFLCAGGEPGIDACNVSN